MRYLAVAVRAKTQRQPDGKLCVNIYTYTYMYIERQTYCRSSKIQNDEYVHTGFTCGVHTLRKIYLMLNSQDPPSMPTHKDKNSHQTSVHEECVRSSGDMKGGKTECKDRSIGRYING